MIARAAVVLLLVAPAASAQSLASRVADVREGAATFHYAARVGVCGDGRGWIRIGRSYMGHWSSESRETVCVEGPVQVRLSMHEGKVERVETWVGAVRDRAARDLGAVPALEAASFLLDVAAHGSSPASASALLPAVLADSATVWPALLGIARDSANRPRATRQEGSFWLARFAANAMYGHPDRFADDESESDDTVELKKHAVFVLSQLPDRSGESALLEVARSNRDRQVRSQALFWLGQIGDASALALFESLLRG